MSVHRPFGFEESSFGRFPVRLIQVSVKGLTRNTKPVVVESHREFWWKNSSSTCEIKESWGIIEKFDILSGLTTSLCLDTGFRSKTVRDRHTYNHSTNGRDSELLL